MENSATPRSSRLGTLLGFLLFLAVPAGLAYMYPKDAAQAYERAGQLIRGDYGPADLIPPNGKEVSVKQDGAGFTDVRLPSAQTAIDAEQDRVKRAIEAGVQAEAKSVALSADQQPTGPKIDILGGTLDTAAPAAPSQAASDVTTSAAPAAATAPTTAPAAASTPAAVTSPAATAAPTTAPKAQATPAAAPKGPSASTGAGGPQQGAAVAAAPVTAQATPAPAPALVYEAAPTVQKTAERAARAVDVAPIAGAWGGSFEGPAKGRLELVVTPNGLLRGFVTPDSSTRRISVEGRFNDSTGVIEFHQAAGNSSAWNFLGRITASGGEGQWTTANPDIAPGTWAVSRNLPAMDEARAAMQNRLGSLKR